jgi:benzoyl-CoA reductase/2-hydroxyglutaryl-CoA dehydratase subunit BcrC/BadD/HgdB
MFVVRRKPVRLAVRMLVQYSDTCMNQRKVYERMEELKGIETGVDGRYVWQSSATHIDIKE